MTSSCKQCGTPIEEAGAEHCPSCQGDTMAPAGTWSSSAKMEDRESGERVSTPPADRDSIPDGILSDRPESASTGRTSRTSRPALRLMVQSPTLVAPSVTPPDITPLPAASAALAIVPEPSDEVAIPEEDEHPEADTPRNSSVPPVGDSVSPAEAETFTAPPSASPAAPSSVPPPLLASELLRDDLEPHEPGRLTLRWVGGTLGILGALSTLGVGGMDPRAIALAGLCLLVGIACLSPVRYATRASLAVGLSVLGMGGATYLRIESGADLSEPLLALAVTVLSGGLLFRAWYRASKIARGAVVIGAVALVLWFVDTGSLDTFVIDNASWIGWAMAAIRVLFGLLLLLSLLVFMDEATTAGARLWAATLLPVYVVHVVLGLGARFTEAVATGTVALPDPVAAISLANCLLVVIGGLSVAQLLVSIVATDQR